MSEAPQKSESLIQDKNLRYAVIAALIAIVVAPFIAMSFSMAWSVVVLVEIAVIAFFTVIFVMIIGSKEDHYPKAVEDSPSVLAWSQRLAAAEQAAVQENLDAMEKVSGDGVENLADDATPNEVAAATRSEAKDTGKAVGDLSDDEREAKRQAALERRKARAAKKAESDS